MILRKRIKKRILIALKNNAWDTPAAAFCVRRRCFVTQAQGVLRIQRMRDTPMMFRGFYGSIGA